MKILIYLIAAIFFTLWALTILVLQFLLDIHLVSTLTIPAILTVSAISFWVLFASTRTGTITARSMILFAAILFTLLAPFELFSSIHTFIEIHFGDIKSGYATYLFIAYYLLFLLLASAAITFWVQFARSKPAPETASAGGTSSAAPADKPEPLFWVWASRLSAVAGIVSYAVDKYFFPGPG